MTMGIKRLEPEREDLERIKGQEMRVTLWGLHSPGDPRSLRNQVLITM